MRLYLGGVIEFKKENHARGVADDYLNSLTLTLLATATVPAGWKYNPRH